MLKPVPMTHAELTAVVKDMAAVVEAQDSFEGFIEYGMPDPEDGAPGDTFALVKASYRVGNSMGQGGVRMIGDVDSELNWSHTVYDALRVLVHTHLPSMEITTSPSDLYERGLVERVGSTPMMTREGKALVDKVLKP